MFPGKRPLFDPNYEWKSLSFSLCYICILWKINRNHGTETFNLLPSIFGINIWYLTHSSNNLCSNLAKIWARMCRFCFNHKKHPYTTLCATSVLLPVWIYQRMQAGSSIPHMFTLYKLQKTKELRTANKLNLIPSQTIHSISSLWVAGGNTGFAYRILIIFGKIFIIMYFLYV